MTIGTAVDSSYSLTQRFELPPSFWTPAAMTSGKPSFSFFGWQVVPQDTIIKGTPFKLASDLVVELLGDESQIIAKVRLVDEYGMGTSPDEAIRDLLTSLADYLSSLERREAQIGESLTRDLQNLRTLLKMQ